MPETATKRYGEMSPEELEARAAEIRCDVDKAFAAEPDSRDETAIRSAILEIDAVDRFLTAFRHKQREENDRHLAEQLAQSQGPRGAFTETRSGRIVTGGDLVMENDAMKDWVRSGMRAEPFNFTVDAGIDDFWLPSHGVRALTEYAGGGPGNNAASGVSGLLPVGQPIPPAPRQAKLYLRDLIPVQPTTLPQVPYVRELTPTANEFGASAVAEGNLKPDVGVLFTPATAYVTVIAGNVSPTRQLWEDAGLVSAYINQRLPYLVKFKEDWEFLNGSGTYPDIQGLLNVTGIQSQTATSGDPIITIANAIAKVENVDGEPTGVVMNSTDAWGMFDHRASTSGVLDAGNPFQMASLRSLSVWGLPVYRTRAKAAGTALVGDFQRGAMILDREQVNVQVYPQHSDYAARNQILVQCEERVGLMVPRPDLFVNATL